MADAQPTEAARRWFSVLGAACARINERSRAMTPSERSSNLGRGAGGDITAGIDRMAEDELLIALRRLHHEDGISMTLLSEEVGVMEIGSGGTPIVVADPIDGSQNAKRGGTVYCTAIAVANRPTMGGVWLAMVHDHGSGESFTAERGVGVWVNARPAERPPVPSRIRLLGVEGASPVRLAGALEVVGNRISRVRCPGSLALSMVWTAAGRTDAMVGLGPARSVDVAAAQLIATELGCIVGLPTPAELDGTPLDLGTRRRVVACASPELLDTLVEVVARAG